MDGLGTFVYSEKGVPMIPCLTVYQPMIVPVQYVYYGTSPIAQTFEHAYVPQSYLSPSCITTHKNASLLNEVDSFLIFQFLLYFI